MTLAPAISVSPAVAGAAAVLDHDHYRHHRGRGRTPHITNPRYVQRDITHLDVQPGTRVLEIGTGSGYSGTLLAHLTGPGGAVTSVDMDAYLVRWANVIHDQAGTAAIRCHTTDGTGGYPPGAPYDRIGAWCAPPLLPAAWIKQCAPKARIVTTLPVAPVADISVLAVLAVTGGRPEVELLDRGSYIDATPAPRADLSLPGHRVDWEARRPRPGWISIAWRQRDDWLHTGARATLDSLLAPGHTEPAPDVTWGDLLLWLASTGDEYLTTAGLGPGVVAAGHSTPDTAAAITDDGRLVADHPDSLSLRALRNWIDTWHTAGCPGLNTYSPTLKHDNNETEGAGPAGWHLNLTRTS
ncbi:protein-L-isoaspartate O-methyltransferase family protein [Streptomyces xiamenensis]